MSRWSSMRRASSLLLLALWWGGFTFYAGRVVFIGHEILRSKIRQGFITERVTSELNWLGLFTLGVVACELLACGKHSRHRVAWSSWAVAIATTIALVLLHIKLAAMLDFTARQVSDDNAFYGWHRLYLCTAALQWLSGGILLVALHFHLCPPNPNQRSAG